MSDPFFPQRERAPVAKRWFGVPVLFAVAFSAIGFSLYFSLGLVADRGLGLTPLIFLAVGLVFLLNTMTYVEGEGMIPERGGSATFARRAFGNELIGFIAGWAIIIDYVIVIALAAISVPHYLAPVWSGFDDAGGEIATAAAVIAASVALTVVSFSGAGRQRVWIGISLGGLALLLAVIGVGLMTSFDLDVLTTDLSPFHSFANPGIEDLIYAGVIATVAFAGIEAAATLAPEAPSSPTDLRRMVITTAVGVPLIYFGVSVVALMAVPVAPAPGGAETALGERFLVSPILGVAQSFEPAWVANVMEVAVVVVVPLALVWAASTAMLGLSRHVYVMATSRQIPSWLGKLNRRFQTPHVAIALAGLAALGLVLPTDVELLAGLFAFGATIAFTIAHVSILRLRAREPEAERRFRVPLGVRVRGVELPLPTLVAAVLTAAAWVSVVVFHDTARWVGAAWMVFGIVAYAIYRRGIEGTTLTGRVEVPAEALVKDLREAEYGDILVPVFGTKLDDEIVGTAGRLAAGTGGGKEAGPTLELLFVIELPLTVPPGAPPSPEQAERANAALARAAEVALEYETVEVRSSAVRARTVGAGIVDAARERGVEVIVMGGEPPSRVRGGAVLGGVGGSRPDEVGPVTEYVLRRAPCRVLVTAPGDGIDAQSGPGDAGAQAPAGSLAADGAPEAGPPGGAD